MKQFVGTVRHLDRWTTGADRMKRLVLFGCATLALSSAISCMRSSEPPFDRVQYRGQTIMLAKPYSDHEEYEEDPRNLSPSELTRVQRLVREAPVDRTYIGRDRLTKDDFDLRFPGYGMSAFGEQVQADGSVLTGFSIEIPGVTQDRILVFRGKGASYRLIDDFVESSALAIQGVKEEAGSLVYRSMNGGPVLTRPIVEK